MLPIVNDEFSVECAIVCSPRRSELGFQRVRPGADSGPGLAAFPDTSGFWAFVSRTHQTIGYSAIRATTSRNRRATARLSHLEAEPLRTATEWLARYQAFWDESHERLDALLASLTRQLER